MAHYRSQQFFFAFLPPSATDRKTCVHGYDSVTTNMSNSCISSGHGESTRGLFELLSHLDYAVERGLASIAVPLQGDVDLLLSECDREKCFERIKKSGMLIYAASAYGGTRLFLGDNLRGIKRLDVTWKLHYRGVRLLPVDQLLAQSTVDSITGLKVLPERIAMEIAWAIKNAYSGAEKYRASMENHGFSVLSSNQRRKWLLGLAIKQPLDSLYGAIRCVLHYCRRFWKPTGLMIGGTSPSILNQSALLIYLSQSRGIRQYGTFVGYLRSRLMSEICVVGSTLLADLNLSGNANVFTCEKEIVSYLRERRVDLD